MIEGHIFHFMISIHTFLVCFKSIFFILLAVVVCQTLKSNCLTEQKWPLVLVLNLGRQVERSASVCVSHHHCILIHVSISEGKFPVFSPPHAQQDSN